MAPSKETKTSLPISGTTFAPGLLDRLGRAAGQLPGRDPRAHLFLESRYERRLEVGGEGGPVALAGRLQGLAAEHAPGIGVFVSAPTLDDLERALARVLRGDPESAEGTRLVPAQEPPSQGDLVQTLVALARRTSRGAGGREARVTWVEIDQEVAVACRDGRQAAERRRGRRVLLEIDGVAGGRVLPEGDAIEPVLQGLAAEVATRAGARGDRGTAPAGPGWVVFAPGVGGTLLHELVGHALEADTIGRGESRLAGWEGTVAGPGVTVLDDPRRGRLPWRFDDEGVEARPTALVQAGRVVGALGSWRWPGAKGVSTGHGRRASFAEPVLPRMGGTFLAPGPLAPEEVLEGIVHGVYVRHVAGAWADPSAGTATFHVRDADAIRDGRIERALGSFFVVARVEDLVSLDRIADDLAFDHGGGACVREGQALATSVGAPTFRLGLTTVPM